MRDLSLIEEYPQKSASIVIQYLPKFGGDTTTQREEMNELIECKIYTLAELKEVLKISKRQWEERKEEVLEYMKVFFDYEITLKGRSYQFNIKKQYCEYEPLPRKTKSPEIQAFYKQETDHIVQYKKRNTGSNIAREIVSKNNKYNHAVSTATHYICPYLKKNYEVEEREWCEINYEKFSYDKISEEQLNFLNSQFKKYFNSEIIANAIADQEAGYTTKEEAYEKLKARYHEVMDVFRHKYGFRPYKAGELIKKAWVVED